MKRSDLRTGKPVAGCLLVLIAILFLAPGASADTNTPVEVRTGIYVNRIDGINLAAGTFQADVYIYFYFDAAETENIQINEIEFMNGEVDIISPTADEKELAYHRGGKIARQVFRLRGTFHAPFDLRSYPLDRHELPIEVEHKFRNASRLVFVPDERYSAVDEGVRLSTFEVAGLAVRSDFRRYKTHFGNVDHIREDGSLADQPPYSRATYVVKIGRPPGRYLFKSFFLLFVIVGVTFLALLLDPVRTDPKISITSGGILAVIAAQWIMNTNLPEVGYVTLADKIYYLSYIAVGIVFLESLVTTNFVSEKPAEGKIRARRWDKITASIVPLVYVLGVVWILSHA